MHPIMSKQSARSQKKNAKISFGNYKEDFKPFDRYLVKTLPLASVQISKFDVRHFFISGVTFTNC